jgi:hypothetical protein
MSRTGRGLRKRPLAVGTRVKRRGHGRLTRLGTVVELIEPREAFDAVRRVAVDWDGSAAITEPWPVEFLVVVDDEAEEPA